MMKHLVKLMYHTSGDLQFGDHGLHKSFQKDQQKNRTKLILSLRQQAKKKQFNASTTEAKHVPMLTMMHEHFRLQCRGLGRESVISFGMPRSRIADVEAVDLNMAALSAPAGHHIRHELSVPTGATALLADDCGDAEWDFGDQIDIVEQAVVAPCTPDQMLVALPPPSHESDSLITTFFMVHDVSPSRRHTMPIAPSLMPPRGEADIIMSAHRCIELQPEMAVVECMPSPLAIAI